MPPAGRRCRWVEVRDFTDADLDRDRVEVDRAVVDSRVSQLHDVVPGLCVRLGVDREIVAVQCEEGWERGAKFGNISDDSGLVTGSERSRAVARSDWCSGSL